MATTTRLDREKKQIILDQVWDSIYSAPESRLKNQLEEIISKNASLSGSGDLLFFYKGEFYSCAGAKRTVGKTHPLSALLKPYMEEYLEEKASLKNEMSFVKASLATVFNTSNNVTDYLRILPECLHPALRPFKALRNMQEPIPEETVLAIQEKSKSAFSMIKQRLLHNLIV